MVYCYTKYLRLGGSSFITKRTGHMVREDELSISIHRKCNICWDTEKLSWLYQLSIGLSVTNIMHATIIEARESPFKE